MMVCTCCGQWKIKEIVLNDRRMLRVYSHGFFVADVATTAEVAKILHDGGVRLQDLVEVQG